MSEEFCNGVKIILARMDSNPDEFAGYGGRWGDLLEGVVQRATGATVNTWLAYALTDEEAQALYTKLQGIKRQEFDEWVMKRVLQEEEMARYDREMQAISNKPVGVRRPATGYTAPASQEKMIEKHLEMHRALLAQGQPIK